MKKIIKHSFIGIACGIFTCLLSYLPITELIELKGYDLLHLLKDAYTKQPPIVLVAIDEPSFAELNMQWPWNRRVHAQLINTLKKSGAKVIALDILFVEPSNPEDDKTLSKAVKDAGNVVLASDINIITDKKYLQEMVIVPLPILSTYSKIGLVSLPIDRDNVVRRLPQSKEGQKLFAEQIASLYIGKEMNVPLNAYISYNFLPGNFIKISYYQALKPNEYLPNNFFKDKIVIVGRATATTLEPQKIQADYFPTPFLFLKGTQEGLISGMEIHGYIVNNLLENSFVMSMNSFHKGLLILLAGIFGSFLNINWRPFLTSIIVLTAVIVYLATALFLFEKYMIWIPTFTIVISMSLPYFYFALNAYILSERKKREIKRVFSHYISKSVLEEILKKPDNLKLGGERVEATVLFSDITGFTSLSEKLPPEKIAYILNRYMTAMTKIIIQNKGTVDKFIGDAIMAFWGAPVLDKEHAINACKAAVSMQKRMNSLREEFRLEGLPEISHKIGISTGIVIVGNMGSEDLFDYTVIGDTVNLANRLVDANKNFGTNILISRYVYEQARDFIDARSLGFINVKGKEEKIEVFELIDVLK